MKHLLVIILFLSGLHMAVVSSATAACYPNAIQLPENPVMDKKAEINSFSGLKMKDLQKLAGRKFTLKEKIAVKIFQYILKKEGRKKRPEPDNPKKGELAMILGIIGLASLIIPLYFLSIASVPLAVLAIVFGSSALKKDRGDKMAKAGIILGAITLALIAIAVILVIVVLSTWYR
jgi:hypothetical protein